MPEAPRPSLAWLCDLVLQGIPNPSTRSMYGKALRDFLSCDHPELSREGVQRHKEILLSQQYSSASINQRLSAIRRLALEAADNGFLSRDAAAMIARVSGVKKKPTRSGKWLTTAEAETLINAPDPATPKGIRDRAILATMVGCGLRRRELADLEINDIAKREGRWVLVDIKGKHGRVRTVPLPLWVKNAIDLWLKIADVRDGRVFRVLDRAGQAGLRGLSAPAFLQLVATYGQLASLSVTPHDLRRTCAKLCRSSGGDLEQIQMLLGHSSIQITEQYLGTRQDLAKAPNDRIGLRWSTPKRVAS
jgi:integrase/recombinase XerD